MDLMTTGHVRVKAPLWNKSDEQKDEEERAHTLYNSILKMVYKILGDQTTDGNVLYTTGRKLIGSNFSVKARDQIVDNILEKGEHYFCVNTDVIQLGGTHWMLLYQKDDDLFFYDSFGRKWQKMIPELEIFKNDMRITNFDTTDREQDKRKNDCGARVISMCLLIKHFGIQTAILV